MNFLFQSAYDAANLAHRVVLGFRGKLKPQEKESFRPIKRLTVEIGYERHVETNDGVVYRDTQFSAKLNRLVAQYLEGHLEAALDYAVQNLDMQADLALVSSKKVLLEYIDRINELEKNITEVPNV